MARFKVNKNEVKKAWLKEQGLESGDLDEVLQLAQFNVDGELTGFKTIETEEEGEEIEVNDDEYVPDESQIVKEEEKEEEGEESKPESQETKKDKNETSTLMKRSQKEEPSGKLPTGQKDLAAHWDEQVKKELGE